MDTDSGKVTETPSGRPSIWICTRVETFWLNSVLSEKAVEKPSLRASVRLAGRKKFAGRIKTTSDSKSTSRPGRTLEITSTERCSSRITNPAPGATRRFATTRSTSVAAISKRTPSRVIGLRVLTPWGIRTVRIPEARSVSSIVRIRIAGYGAGILNGNAVVDNNLTRPRSSSLHGENERPRQRRSIRFRHLCRITDDDEKSLRQKRWLREENGQGDAQRKQTPENASLVFVAEHPPIISPYSKPWQSSLRDAVRCL